MATGSGKTLLMHINYYQYLAYAEEDGSLPDNILLVTPNEGLSQQHIEELRESSIPCRHFNAESTDLWSSGKHPVKVIEIQKLTEDKSGDGLSIQVDAFEGQNLVLVDEGHKGAGSKAQTWRNRRQQLAESGFTFEYSATFGQAIAGASAAVEEEYGKAILFDYSYPRFYDDGYGKDYRILNMESDIDDELRDRYLLANLLTFYEQIHVYNSEPDTFRDKYNIRDPLLVFIGHSVNADKTSSRLSSNDKQSLSDVEDVLLFLGKVLKNEDGWVPEAIDAILHGESGLSLEDEDLFEDEFEALRETGLRGEAVYHEMLEQIFHTESSTDLHLADITDASGEIGLRASTSDSYFGVINIGNDRVFLDRVEDHDAIAIEDDQFRESLFHEINKHDSDVNVLLGSRKFIEGWDSWRVSTMGLMNFGRGKGPQVIQLFGRGVRLLGKNQTLKRSRELPGDHPDHITKLETLNIFGVRADYMEEFRDYLSEEGIDTEPRETVEIDTETQEHFQDEGLLVVRPQATSSFDQEEYIQLEASSSVSPTVDVAPRVGKLDSQEEYDEEGSEQVERSLPEEAIEFLDWDHLYQKLWQFRSARGYDNQVVSKGELREVIEDGYYTLYCPEHMVSFNEFSDLDQIRELVLMILRKHIEEEYRGAEKRWEQSQLTYLPVDDEIDQNDGVLVQSYTAAVKESAEEFLNELEAALEDDDLYEGDDGVPNRVHFDRHLYLPLLAEETGTHADEVDYSPPGLNEGEQELVQQVKAYFHTEESRDLLTNWEVYLLRNQARGRGIGFLAGSEGNQRFFPDFILWLKNDDHQHIIFLDPHGMALEGDPRANHRVELHEEIKEWEAQLADRTGRDDVSLHSYIVSVTDFEDLIEKLVLDNRQEFYNLGVYFQDDGVQPILQDVIEG